jgi:DNA-binding CsgD family transcriptional regulator
MGHVGYGIFSFCKILINRKYFMTNSEKGLYPKEPSNLSGFLSYLSSQPELRELCNAIVFKWRASDRSADACIGEIGVDGSFTFSGSFRYEEEKSELNSAVTVWDNHPAAVAVRDQKALLLTDRGEIEGQFPELAATMPNLSSVVAVPLMARGTPHGVFVACSDEPLADSEEALELLEEYSLALSLYVSNLRGREERAQFRNDRRDHRQNPGASPPATGPINAPERPTLVPHQLSQRQLTVLDFLAQGYSNREIGRLIGFSESTVRQDTMAIYAFLGVSGRKEAVKAWIVRHMVEITPDEAPSAL